MSSSVVQNSYAILPSEEAQQRFINETLPLVPDRRREQALRYRYLAGQYCCLRSWQMLYELLLEQRFIAPETRLCELTYELTEQGKPFLTLPERLQLRPICFSLSHTRNALAVAVSEKPVGIDIEALISPKRLQDEAFLRYVLSDEEYKLLKSCQSIGSAQVLLTEWWTQKEAIYKARGTGIDISSLRTILATDHGYRLTTMHNELFAMTVAE